MCRVPNGRRAWTLLTVAVCLLLGAQSQAVAQGFTPDSIAEGQAQAQQAVMPAAVRMSLPMSTQPPQFSAEQLAAMQAWQAQTHRPGVMGPQSAAIAGPAAGTETVPAGSPSPGAPGSFIVLQSQPLNPGGAGLPQSNINEPSVAQEGGYVFYTGNWYAARSICGGNDYGAPQWCQGGSWLYINPTSGFPDFCCDQDVVKDNRRQMLFWYRQGIFNHPSGPPNQNRFILGLSFDGFASACYYDFRPTTLNAGYAGTWFDYPQLSVTNDYLWIVTNNFNAAGNFVRQLFIKLPLDGLYTCGGFGFSYFDAPTNGWAGPVQGGRTQMYFGGHGGSNNSFRVFWWNEDSGTIFWADRAIPAFTFQNGNSSCTARPGGPDWTNRGDSRIKAGWVRHLNPTPAGAADENVGQVGFMWHANQGGGFPQPYVEAATFRQDNLNVTGRPLIWNGAACLQYPFASPNATGDLGLTVYWSSASEHVSTLLGLDDDYNGVPPGWEIYFGRVGGGAPPSNAWGDYVRNRPHNPSGKMWVSSGHTMQGGAVEPRYYVFGRERDQLSYWKYIWSHW